MPRSARPKVKKGPTPSSRRKSSQSSPPREAKKNHKASQSAAVNSPVPSPSENTPGHDGQKGHWIYGRHAVSAVLKNPIRHINRIFITRAATNWCLDHGLQDSLIHHRAEEITTDLMDQVLPAGAVHQGLAVDCDPLDGIALDQLDDTQDEPSGPVVILDQVTDPQNIGAIFRIAAAFHARAIIVQDRRTPPLSGALAKAAAGTIDRVPIHYAVNIARALRELKDRGYYCIGLAGEGATPLAHCTPTTKLALVLGAEGSGLRALVAKTCDELVHIPISAEVESLNVASAGAIALYTLGQKA